MPAPRAIDWVEESHDRSSDDVRFLAAFGRSLATSVDLTSTSKTALDTLTQRLGVEAGAIFLVDEQGGDLVCHGFTGTADLCGLRAKPDDRLLGRCLRRNAVEIVHRPADSEPLGAPWDEVGFVVRSALCAPLTAENRALGVIMFANKAGNGRFDPHEGYLLDAAARMFAQSACNARKSEELARRDLLEQELRRAAEIQRDLLPDAEPGQLPVYGLNRPIRLFSGDFFDFFALPDGRIPFCLGDVSGKGLHAALLMAKSASLFRCLAKRSNDPAAILSIMNGEIFETSRRGMFVTMVAGIYDPSSGRLRFSNVGHQPPLLRRKDHSYQSFPAAAPPLGIMPSWQFRDEEIDLSGGEFYIFSDGLTEFRYRDTEDLGADGLIQMVEGLSHLPLAERVRALLSELDREGWLMRDDLTVLAIDDAWVKAHA